MPTSQMAWVWVDLGLKMDTSAEIANADVVQVAVCAPVFDKGTIVAIRYGAITAPDNARLGLYKSGGARFTEVTSSQTSGVTTGVGTQIALTSNLVGLQVNSVDMLYAVWTVTTVGSGDGLGCMVAIEPNTW